MKRFFCSTLLTALVLSGAEAKKSPLRTLDFSNFTYPGFWSGPIRLKGGKLERESGHCISEYSFEGVKYRDLTGDGEEEALVTLKDWTACGSSGVSSYFYIYALKNGKVRLLWRFSTGSEGICGLKKFELQGKNLVFELFGRCHVRGIKFGGGGAVECCPTEYTRIRVAWNGRQFKQKSATVFPYMAK